MISQQQQSTQRNRQSLDSRMSSRIIQLMIGLCYISLLHYHASHYNVEAYTIPTRAQQKSLYQTSTSTRIHQNEQQRVTAVLSRSKLFYSPVSLHSDNQRNRLATKYMNTNQGVFSKILQRHRSHDVTTSKLSMTTAATAVVVSSVGAIAGAISGGFFAGSLHAVAGPDHLAALLPRCCGQRWYKAGRVGALWGMGHGVSATLLGVTAFAVKRTLGNNLRPGLRTVLESASHVTELAVGLSLILIGLMGIKEAREWQHAEAEAKVVTASGSGATAIASTGGANKSLSAAAVDTTNAGLNESTKRAVILNGLLHGFSWDGAPGLAPALAVATWTGNLAFLAAYAAGTTASMAVVTTAVGEGTRRAGQIFNRPDLPQKLSIASSIVAMIIGAVWCGLALS